MKRRRIGFLSARDPRSRLSWSGTYYYMAQALEKYCGDIVYIGPVTSPVESLNRWRSRISKYLLGKPFFHQHTRLHSKDLARRFKKLLPDDIDLIFAPAASTEIAYLDTDIPIVYASDITFELMHQHYDMEYGLLSEHFISEGNELEQRALDKASHILYPAEWAAVSAQNFYKAPRSKIHVFPYGANFDAIPDRDTVIQAKNFDQCRLLFVGVNWRRKGGDIAYETLRRLRSMGLNSRLVMCGCAPPSPVDSNFVQIIPRLNKEIEAERDVLRALFLSANFFFLPTRAEAFGIVFCEASGFGTPSITTGVGGVSGVISEGKNGFMLPLEAGPEHYAQLIADIFGDRPRYVNLVSSSRSLYEERLNWDSWGKEVNRVLSLL